MERTTAIFAALVVAFVIFLPCACGERREEPPSAATMPAPMATVEPTPATEPTLTPTAVPPPSLTEQLAFVGVDGDIWLVNADGSGLRKFASDVCEGIGGGSAKYLAWSPTGDKLACVCSDPDYERSLIVLDEAGRQLARLQGRNRFSWSPDGRQIAYESGPAWPPDELWVLDVGSLEDRAVARTAGPWLMLLAWPVPGRLLVGVERVGEPPGVFVPYDTYWLHLDSGELERVPRFDDAQFWLAPSGQWAVVLDRSQAGWGLAIFDPLTGNEKPIVGSSIAYPSEGIPGAHVAISPDSSTIYWATSEWTTSEWEEGIGPTVTVWKAQADASGLTRLGAVPSGLVTVSGYGRVAYCADAAYGPFSEPCKIVIADLQRGTHTEIGEGLLSGAWSGTS